MDIKEIPNEYIKVDYIQSSGTQYIDTGIKPTSDIGVYLKTVTNETSATTDNILLGSRDSVGNRYFIYLPTSFNVFGIGWGINNVFNDVNISPDTEYTVLFNYNNDKKIILNNQEIEYTFSEYSGNVML